MTENFDRDQVIDDSVVLKVLCEACGEIAVMKLTPEQARKTAMGLMAAADGLPRLEDLEVRGRG